jgi:hypothetical protein
VHAPASQLTLHDSALEQSIGPWQAPAPQSTLQDDPPQTIGPRQALAPHSTSQLVAFAQSISPPHPLAPQSTRQ